MPFNRFDLSRFAHVEITDADEPPVPQPRRKPRVLCSVCGLLWAARKDGLPIVHSDHLADRTCAGTLKPGLLPDDGRAKSAATPETLPARAA